MKSGNSRGRGVILRLPAQRGEGGWDDAPSSSAAVAAAAEGLLPEAGAVHPPQLGFPVVRTRAIEGRPAPGEEGARWVSVVAPTGYGKTVLLGEWYRRAAADGEHVFWVVPPRQGGMPVERLLDALETALGAAPAGGSGVTARIDRLLAHLRQIAAPATVFIDAFERCCDEAAGALVEWLVAHSPPVVRWVVASRYELPVDRIGARLDGTLHEFHAADLAFDSVALQRLLEPDLRGRLDEEDLHAVLHLTEGWPAALRLLLQRVRNGEHPGAALRRLGDADEDLERLFERRVLSPFAPDLRDFLLELSLLPSFCPELCRAVSLQAGPVAMLARVRTLGCFVVAQDERSSRLRLNGLFRTFLRRQCLLQLDEPRRQCLLEQAAAWFEARGDWREAIQVRIEARQFPAAIQLLERSAAMLVRDRGELERVSEWVEHLREQGYEVGPETDFWFVWALIFRRQHAYSISRADFLQHRLAQAEVAGGPGSAAHRLHEAVAVIRACGEIYDDQPGPAAASAGEWIAGHPHGDPFHFATSATIRSLVLTDACRLAEARAEIRRAHEVVIQTGSHYGRGWVAMIDALIKTREGDCLRAREELRAAMDLLRAELGGDAPLMTSMALVGARCALDVGEEAEARDLLTFGLGRVQNHGVLDLVACGMDVAVRLWMGTGDEPARMAQLRRVARGYPPRLSLMLSCYRIRALLRLNRVAEAMEEAADIGLEGDRLRPTAAPPCVAQSAACRALYIATHLRLQIAQSAFVKAAELVEEEIRLARSELRSGDLVDLLLQSTTLAVFRADAESARKLYLRAVAIAANYQLLRPFQEQAACITELVCESRPRDWGFTREEDRKFFAGLCRHLPLARQELKEELERLGSPCELAAPLTQRELELLRLLDAGLSNHQLAGHLEVSVPTVKWHLYNLYGKIGARTRSAVIARARILNLMPKR